MEGLEFWIVVLAMVPLLPALSGREAGGQIPCCRPAAAGFSPPASRAVAMHHLPGEKIADGGQANMWVGPYIQR